MKVGTRIMRCWIWFIAALSIVGCATPNWPDMETLGDHVLIYQVSYPLAITTEILVRPDDEVKRRIDGGGKCRENPCIKSWRKPGIWGKIEHMVMSGGGKNYTIISHDNDIEDGGSSSVYVRVGNYVALHHSFTGLETYDDATLEISELLRDYH